ncbi:MAG: hypothetical protein AB9888_15525 [Bacteroidales bacterium]
MNVTWASHVYPSVWGTKALNISLPGRGILFMDGTVQYQFFQAYFAPTDLDRVLHERIVDVNEQPIRVLSSLEYEMVKYSLENEEGKFVVGRIWPAFKDKISHQGVADLAKRWEIYGWLTKPSSAVDCRRITNELKGLVEVDK